MGTAQHPRVVPTEASPEDGIYQSHGVVLSHGKRWVEDGIHVIRSTEFDVWGEGESLEAAVEDFGDALSAYYAHLAALASEGAATQDELANKAILTQRVYEANQVHDTELEGIRTRDLLFRRYKRQHSRSWHTSSAHPSSRELSTV